MCLCQHLSLSASQIQGMPWTDEALGVFNRGVGDVTGSAWSSKVLSVSLNLLHANPACMPAPLPPASGLPLSPSHLLLCSSGSSSVCAHSCAQHSNVLSLLLII